MSPAEPIPTATGIDHDWLRRHLGWRVGADDPIAVQPISRSGDLMGVVHRVSCAGRSFVFKGPPSAATAWGRFAVEDGVVVREVRTYRLLGGAGPAAEAVPDCYWSALAGDGRGALALRDLTATPDDIPTMAAGLGLAQACATIRALATVHRAVGAVSGDPLTPPYPWLYSAASEGLVAAVRMGLDDLPGLVAAHWPDGLPDLAPALTGTLDVAEILRQAHLGARYLALCHGDAWASNVLFVRSKSRPERFRAYLIDWQFAMWGNPMSDVALLLWSSLDPDCREAWQDRIVDHYHRIVTEDGTVDYPLAACHRDLRRAEPAAALTVLATVEAYASGMDRLGLSRLGARLSAAGRRLAGALRR